MVDYGDDTRVDPALYDAVLYGIPRGLTVQRLSKRQHALLKAEVEECRRLGRRPPHCWACSKVGTDEAWRRHQRWLARRKEKRAARRKAQEAAGADA